MLLGKDRVFFNIRMETYILETGIMINLKDMGSIYLRVDKNMRDILEMGLKIRWELFTMMLLVFIMVIGRMM